MIVQIWREINANSGPFLTPSTQNCVACGALGADHGGGYVIRSTEMGALEVLATWCSDDCRSKVVASGGCCGRWKPYMGFVEALFTQPSECGYDPKWDIPLE